MEDPSRQEYQYEPLKYDDSLRVLDLLPAAPQAPLQCRIREVRLSQDTEYEALSYVWGAPNFPTSMEETGSESIFRITENLFDALHSLRYQDEPRTLWVDAICIDQSPDKPEKGRQVAQMGKIYRNARFVVVWLGGEECEEAVDILEELGHEYSHFGIPDTINGKPVDFNKDTVERQQNLLFRPGGGSLALFFERPYFERAWVQQEFALAQRLLIYAGHRVIRYELLRKAMHVLWILRDSAAPLMTEESPLARLGSLLGSGLDAMRAVFDKFRGPLQMSSPRQNHGYAANLHPSIQTGSRKRSQKITSRLVDCFRVNPAMLAPCCRMINFRDGLHGNPDSMDDPLYWWYTTSPLTKCSNERDRLFALFGVANPLSIIPDYKKPIHQVWLEVTLKYLRAGKVSVLHYARGLSKATGDGKTLSFVPNFDVGVQNFRLPMIAVGYGVFRAGCHTQARVNSQLFRGQFPQLSGVHVDHVTSVSKTYVETLGTEPQKVRNEVDLGALQGLYSDIQDRVGSVACPYDESFLSVLARTLIADNQMTAADFSRPMDWIKVAFTLFLVGPWTSTPEYTSGKVAMAEELLGAPLIPTVQAIWPDFLPYDPETGVCDVEAMLSRFDREVVEYVQFGILQVLLRRVVFLTSAGYLGIGPDGMEETDWVIIPDGAGSPFVVRPAGASTCQSDQDQPAPMVQLVGDCYLHGWMDGNLFGHTVVEPSESSHCETGAIGREEISGRSAAVGGSTAQESVPKILDRRSFILC